MDNIQAFVIDLLPANLLSTVTRHTSTYYRIYRTVNNYVGPISRRLASIILGLLHRITYAPDVATFLLLMIVLFLSFQLLNMLKRAVMFWVRMTTRMLFWGSLATLGWWIYVRGVDGAAEDLMQLGSGLMGTWSGEYKYWKEKEDVARRMSNTFGKKGAGSGGAGGGWARGKTGWR